MKIDNTFECKVPSPGSSVAHSFSNSVQPSLSFKLSEGDAATRQARNATKTRDGVRMAAFVYVGVHEVPELNGVC